MCSIKLTTLGFSVHVKLFCRIVSYEQYLAWNYFRVHDPAYFHLSIWLLSERCDWEGNHQIQDVYGMDCEFTVSAANIPESSPVFGTNGTRVGRKCLKRSGTKKWHTEIQSLEFSLASSPKFTPDEKRHSEQSWYVQVFTPLSDNFSSLWVKLNDCLLRYWTIVDMSKPIVTAERPVIHHRNNVITDDDNNKIQMLLTYYYSLSYIVVTVFILTGFLFCIVNLLFSYSVIDWAGFNVSSNTV